MAARDVEPAPRILDGFKNCGGGLYKSDTLGRVYVTMHGWLPTTNDGRELGYFRSAQEAAKVLGDEMAPADELAGDVFDVDLDPTNFPEPPAVVPDIASTEPLPVAQLWGALGDLIGLMADDGYDVPIDVGMQVTGTGCHLLSITMPSQQAAQGWLDNFKWTGETDRYVNTDRREVIMTSAADRVTLFGWTVQLMGSTIAE